MIPYFDVRYNYVEPFFGGGAVFCWMMDNYKFLKVKINDTNKELMEIYKAVRDNSTEFIHEAKMYQTDFLLCSGWSRKLTFQEMIRQYWETQNPSLLYFMMLISFNGVWNTSRTNGMYRGSFGYPKNTIKDFVDVDNIYQWAKLWKRLR